MALPARPLISGDPRECAMTWLSGPCITPGDEPSDQFRAIRQAIERRIADWKTYDDAVESIEEAARWPGREQN